MQTFSFLKIFYFSMFRTKLGMKKMNLWANKHRTLLKRLGYITIPVGFIGMVIMIEELFRGIWMILQNTNNLAVGVVLPIQAKGVFYVPFFYWIIAIMFIMVVHEFGHGLVARAHKVRVKSTGFAFLGALVPIIPGAFVEIDEKHLAKQPKYTQLNIFAAGPFANILFGVLFFGLFLFMQPASEGLFDVDGMSILQVSGDSPAAISGLAVGEIITDIDGKTVNSAKSFNAAFDEKQTGDAMTLTTKLGTKEVVLGEGGRLGVQVQEARHIKESVVESHGWFAPQAFAWTLELIFWLFILNLGVGLFNLVPLGPIDGGRMLHVALLRVVKHKHAKNIWHATSIVIGVILIATIAAAFI